MTLLDIGELCESASRDSEFRITARDWQGWLELGVGDEAPGLLRIEYGAVHRATSVEGGLAASTECTDIIRIRAPEEDWKRLLAPVPTAGWQDINNAPSFTIEADSLVFAAHNLALRRLVELMRQQVHGPPSSSTVTDCAEAFEETVGRYVNLEIGGTRYRVYFEEAGAGIPVLLQHTAGADGRQWRHVLADPEIRRHFRLIAYDLPFHGKSLPPTSIRWWEREYRLSKEFLMAFVVAMANVLELERPVFLGCSVGGMLAPDLAVHYPESFRAVVGINASLGLPTLSPRAQATFDSFNSPHVSADWKASYMLGRTSPTSPEAYRREVAWIYSQGAPSVFTGDIHYHFVDHDLTADQARQIDTSRVGVYLLSGEYDRLTVDGSAARLANCIAGAHYEVVPGVGHFGPAENPTAFAEPLRRVLADISGGAHHREPLTVTPRR